MGDLLMYDKPWHDPDIKAAPMMGDQCSIWVGNFLLGSWQCENPATSIVRMGCVHEHVVDYVTCTDHATVDSMFCNRCTDGADSHECPLTGVIELIGAAS